MARRTDRACCTPWGKRGWWKVWSSSGPGFLVFFFGMRTMTVGWIFSLFASLFFVLWLASFSFLHFYSSFSLSALLAEDGRTDGRTDLVRASLFLRCSLCGPERMAETFLQTYYIASSFFIFCFTLVIRDSHILNSDPNFPAASACQWLVLNVMSVPCALKCSRQSREEMCCWFWCR